MNYSWLPEDEIVSYLYQRLYVCLPIKEISFLIEIINNAIFNNLFSGLKEHLYTLNVWSRGKQLVLFPQES